MSRTRGTKQVLHPGFSFSTDRGKIVRRARIPPDSIQIDEHNVFYIGIGGEIKHVCTEITQALTQRNPVPQVILCNRIIVSIRIKAKEDIPFQAGPFP